jgi:hypothetical protein
VKTTQPRRYLVRPNQGLIAPNGSETISILLVEKDKQILLQSYERLGQSGLDHSKDKFLVQSCVVSPAFATKAAGDSNEMYEALTIMWNSVTSGGSTTPLFNKKLHVRHVVQDPGTISTSRAASPIQSPHFGSPFTRRRRQGLWSKLRGVKSTKELSVGMSLLSTKSREEVVMEIEELKRRLALLEGHQTSRSDPG